MKKSVWLSILLVGLAGWQAQGAPILDQEYAPTTSNLWTMFSDLTRAQTFTVGVPGLLSGFEVLLETPDTTVSTRRFEIHPTTAGVPVYGSTPLAWAMITYGGSSGEHFYGADISAFGISVSPGDVLALVDAGQGVTPGAWAGRNTSELYAGGQLYSTVYTDPPLYTIPSTVYEFLGDRDLGFRTYVDSPSIPAPGALVLGLLGVGMVTRLRQRRAL